MAAIFSNVLRTAFKSTSRQVVHKLSRQSFTTSNQSFHNYKRIKVIIGIAAGGVVSIFCAVGFNVCYLESNTTKSPKKKIVVLGSGWGAVSFLKSLKPDEYDVSVVSPENYFLFTPLLPGVTVGTVESKSIAEPIRKIIMRKHKNGVRFFEAECTEVKVEEKKVVCRDLSEIVGKQEEFSLEYDYLVMAVGATTASYNIPGVKEHTHYLKNIQQAQAIRTNIIDSFETANIPGQPDHEVRRLLHFVVVGGGPTGVEFAAELRDFVKDDLIKYYPKDLVHKCRITLIDGMNKILNTYSEEISRYTEDHFYSEGIDIVTSTFVNGVEPCHMSLKDAKSGHIQNIAYGMCVWCAGIAPREITKQVMKDVPGQSNRLGLITNSYLKVKNARNIYAIGDCATIQNEKLVDCVDHLFGEEDIGSEENLTKEQFESILHKGMKKFPHLCHQFKEIEDAFESVEVDEGNMISKKEFKRFAMEADSRQTALPCTAQVAEQEGKYLGQLFSKHMVELESANMENVASFRYNHLGSFAYVGDNRAVLELPVIGAFKGWSTMWLWRGAYASEALFDPTMKKKKKKKAPINLDELDDVKEPTPVSESRADEPTTETEKEKLSKPEKAMDDLDLEDFSSLKKKKKKKRDRGVLDMNSLGEHLPGTDGSDQTKEEKLNEPLEEDTREYTYEELLKRVFDIMRAKNPNMVEGGKRKFVMKPPQVVRVGTKKTSFVNFTDICKILHRQPKHLLAFLLAELGTSGTVDGTNQLIIKGKFQQKHIENVLKRYIKEYVTCHTCRSPETILHKETRLFFLQCETCGSRCSVQSIKSGFQAVTTKRAQLKNKQQ